MDLRETIERLAKLDDLYAYDEERAHVEEDNILQEIIYELKKSSRLAAAYVAWYEKEDGERVRWYG